MKDIFEIMRSGEEVRQDHPQYNEFMDIVSSTLRKNFISIPLLSTAKGN